MMEWEMVYRKEWGENVVEFLERIKIEGGWLYRNSWSAQYSKYELEPIICFVPDGDK